MSIKAKLDTLVAGQLPAFVREEYPAFVAFLEAYYRFLEQADQPQGLLRSSTDWFDIDATLDAFVPKLRAEFAWDVSDQTILDSRRLVKLINQYYDAKGSETATELFFRILFNEDATVRYPGEFILRASDGRWVQRRTIKLATDGFTTTNPYDLANKHITLRFYHYVQNQGVQAVDVKTDCFSVTGTNDPNIFELEVAKTADDLQTLYDSDPNLGDLLVGGGRDTRVSVLLGTTSYGYLSRQIISAEVLSGGSGFLVGQTFFIDENSTDGINNRGLVRVIQTTSQDDEVYFAEDYVDPTYSTSATFNILSSVKIISAGYRFIASQFTVNLTPQTGVYATVQFTTGFVKVFSGKFRSPAGFLSDICRTQDNDKYQTYSYIIKTRVPVTEWKEQFLNSAHPIGTRMFNELVLDGDVTYSLDAADQIEFAAFTPI